MCSYFELYAIFIVGIRQLSFMLGSKFMACSKYPPAEPGALRCEPLKAA